MATPRQRTDTVYSPEIYPWWNSLNDRVAYQRAFAQGGPEIKRIAQAMLSQDPLTPREEIRQNMTTRNFPPRLGYNTQETGIVQVLNNDFELAGTHVDDTLWNDFSDTNGEINSTARPNGQWW